MIIDGLAREWVGRAGSNNNSHGKGRGGGDQVCNLFGFIVYICGLSSHKSVIADRHCDP